MKEKKKGLKALFKSKVNKKNLLFIFNFLNSLQLFEQ